MRLRLPGRRTIPKLGLLLLSVCVASLSAELSYRSWLRSRYKDQVAKWQHELYALVPNTRIEYILKADRRRTNRIPGVPDQEWSYKINSDGWRGPEIRTKGTNEQVVLFLGDSYGFGWAVDDDETYVHYVSQSLSDIRDLSVQCINLGVPGYNTVQEHAILARYAHRYSPDAAVVGYVMNDAEPQQSVPLNPDTAYAFVTSWMVADIKGALGIESKVQWHSYDYRIGFGRGSIKWPQSKAALKKIADYCRQNSLILLVAILPECNRALDDDYAYNIIHEQVIDWCNEFGIRSIDLLPRLRSTDSELLAVPGDGHPSPYAHQLIAQQIAPVLEEMLAAGP